MNNVEKLHVLADGYMKVTNEGIKKDRLIDELRKAMLKDSDIDSDSMKTYEVLNTAKEIQSNNENRAIQANMASQVLLQSLTKTSVESAELAKVNADQAQQIADLRQLLAEATGDKYKELHKSSSEMLKELADTKEALATANGEVKNLTRVNLDISNKLEDALKENEELKEKLELTNKKLDLEKEENLMLDKKVTRLTEENDKLNSELDEFSPDYSKVVKDINNANSSSENNSTDDDFDFDFLEQK